MSTATLPARMVTVRQEDATLETVCFEYAYGVLRDRKQAGQLPNYVTATLEANPGLADLGPLLPLGTQIALPEFTIETEAASIRRLWDDE